MFIQDLTESSLQPDELVFLGPPSRGEMWLQRKPVEWRLRRGEGACEPAPVEPADSSANRPRGLKGNKGAVGFMQEGGVNSGTSTQSAS